MVYAQQFSPDATSPNPVKTDAESFVGPSVGLRTGMGISEQTRSYFDLIPTPTGEPLVLSDVYARVMDHHPILVAIRQGVIQARGELLSFWGAFDTQLRAKGTTTPLGKYEYNYLDAGVVQPTPYWGVDFFGFWEYGQGEFYDSDDKLKTSSWGEASVGVSVPLLQGGPIDKERVLIRKGELQVEINEWDIQSTQLKLLQGGAAAYWKWVSAGQKLAIQRYLLELALTRDEAITEQVERGNLAAIERIENRRVILKRKSEVVAARRDLQEAAFKLGLYVRDEAGRPIIPRPEQVPQRIPEAFEPRQASLDEDIQFAFRQRPDVQKLLLKQRQLQVEYQLAENYLLPKLDILGEVARELDRTDLSRSQNPVDLKLSLSFFLPLQMRYARGQMDATEAELIATEARLRFLREQIEAQVQDVYSELMTTYEQIELIRAELEVTQRVEQAERERLNLGASTLLIVNLREQTTADTAKKLVEALANFQSAEARYRALTARGFDLQEEP